MNKAKSTKTKRSKRINKCQGSSDICSCSKCRKEIAVIKKLASKVTALQRSIKSSKQMHWIDLNISATGITVGYSLNGLLTGVMNVVSPTFSQGLNINEFYGSTIFVDHLDWRSLIYWEPTVLASGIHNRVARLMLFMPASTASLLSNPTHYIPSSVYNPWDITAMKAVFVDELKSIGEQYYLIDPDIPCGNFEASQWLVQRNIPIKKTITMSSNSAETDSFISDDIFYFVDWHPSPGYGIIDGNCRLYFYIES